MKAKVTLIIVICTVVVLLYLFGDKLPESIRDLLAPGFFVAVIFNGSLHDRIIPGFGWLGVFVNCVFYSGIVLFGFFLFAKRRKTNRKVTESDAQ